VGSPAHRRPRKIRSTGRHTRPSKVKKAATRAALGAPVVAVAGALVASPLSQVLAATPPTQHLTASGQASKRLPSPGMIFARTGEDGLSATALAIGSRRSTDAARRQHAAAASQQHAKPTAQPTPTPSTSASPAPLTCSGSSYYLPANVQAIVSFLLAHGYSPLAAAGIAGNIFQESKGDPEAVGMGGGGLIGFTPLPAGYITGNYAVDLQTQLNAILTYNQQWSQYIPALNAATNATEAADIYMDDFERPGIPAAANREAAANAVAEACNL
jgi:hypothetical protein